MRRWALLVIALYLLILVGLTMPALVLAFARLPPPAPARIAEAMPFAEWGYWGWIALMAAGQAALLVVPVRVAQGRPVARRTLLLPVVASGLMAAGLAAGAAVAMWETVSGSASLDGAGAWGLPALVAAVWIGWSVVFHRATRAVAPGDVISRMCRTLYRGSILELLVAVPTHVLARFRDHCCAGFLTFSGIAMGLSVMLFSFGPAVFVLYAARWRRLHPRPGDGPTPDAPPRRA